MSRKLCSNCQSSNPPSSSDCWKCGEPLPVDELAACSRNRKRRPLTEQEIIHRQWRNFFLICIALIFLCIGIQVSRTLHAQQVRRELTVWEEKIKNEPGSHILDIRISSNWREMTLIVKDSWYSMSERDQGRYVLGMKRKYEKFCSSHGMRPRVKVEVQDAFFKVLIPMR